MEIDRKKIGDYWSTQTRLASPLRTRWWQIPDCLQHINKVVAGVPVAGFSQGLTNLAIEIAADLAPFKRGISIGCGTGEKEMKLLQSGLVEEFDLFELSVERVQQGQVIASKLNLTQKICFHLEDAFEIIGPSSYDFVHWNNSLHHMPNVPEAVSWSYRTLKQGGMFYLDDYVGPNRFQWSQEMIEVASSVRRILPEKYLVHPRDRDRYLPTSIVSPDPKKVIEQDPSEAGDSERTIDALRLYFPNIKIILTGGVIYSLALSDVYSNFDWDNQNDKTLLKSLLLLDESLARYGLTLYAAALAIKT